MVSPEIIRKRLRFLEGYLKKPNKIKASAQREQFISDEDLQDIVDRNLQLAIEAVLDIGQHIIASSRWEPVDEYSDIFPVLARHNVIPTELAKRVEKMAGFRNILVHEYADIEHDQVFDVLENHLKDLSELAHAYQQFVDT